MLNLLNFIGSNAIIRLYYAFLLIFLTQKLSITDYAEFVKISSLYIFISMVSGIRYELTFLAKDKHNLDILPFTTFASFTVAIVALVSAFFQLNLAWFIIIFAILSHNGNVIALHTDNVNNLLKLRVFTIVISLVIIMTVDVSFMTLVTLTMATYFSGSIFYLYFQSIHVTPLRNVTGSLLQHFKEHYIQILEMTFLAFSNMSLLLFLHSKITSYDYAQVSLCLQFYISSSILVGSNLSLSYYRSLCAEREVKSHRQNMTKIIIIVSCFFSIMLISVNVLNSQINHFIISALYNYQIIAIVAAVYIFVIPFSAILIHQHRYKENLLFHIIMFTTRYAVIYFAPENSIIDFYVAGSTLLYILYGVRIWRLHAN